MASTDERSDEVLMEEYRQGDASALETLVRRYADPLLGFLCRMTGERAQAEDLFQETFLRLHRKAHQYRSGLRFKSWLYAIAAHLAIDTRRRQARAPATVAMDDSDDGRPGLEGRLSDDAPDPAQSLLDDERRRRVRAAVAQLPPRQRATLELAYFEDMSYPEVAAALGCTVGTVKTQMSRALHTLARLLPDPSGDSA